MSRHFGEIHGVDISEEMAALGRRRLRNVARAHIHVTTGSDLSMLAEDYFDFVYSYAVFQHIPDREVVLSYLREARRVLKPAGVLRCQLRGRPPLASELVQETETWTGCHFSAHEIAAFARGNRFPLVALSGIDTQYMWATFRKPARFAIARDPTRVVLKAVTAASGAGVRVPARGREAAVSLWIDGFPENGDLAQFTVSFDGQRQLGCYLSPVSASGGCQLNSFLPPGLQPGRVAVGLSYDDRPVGDPHSIEVVPAPPLNPRVVSVTDGINLTTRFRSETGGAKVIVEELDRPEEVSFHVSGLPVEDLQFECQDPINSTYEFAFHLAPQIQPGIHPLLVNLSGHDLDLIAIEVVFGEER
jgi:SAM-dependent methyltransferase